MEKYIWLAVWLCIALYPTIGNAQPDQTTLSIQSTIANNTERLEQFRYIAQTDLKTTQTISKSLDALRKEYKHSGLWIGLGSALFGMSYTCAAIGALVNGGVDKRFDLYGVLFIPFIGPFISMANIIAESGTFPKEATFGLIVGLAQVFSLGALVYGIVEYVHYLQKRQKILSPTARAVSFQVAPWFAPTAIGVSASFRY